MSKALTEAATKFYEALNEQANLEQIEVTEGEYIEVTTARVFRGKLSDVFASLSVSSSYYSGIRRFLEEHDCIEVLQRANAHRADSVVVLHRPPPSDAQAESRLTNPLAPAILNERLEIQEAFRESITTGGLNIVDALRDHERRLTQIEHKLRQRESDGET